MHQFSVQWSYPTICLSTLHHFANVDCLRHEHTLLTKHVHLTCSPLPATKHDEDANSFSLGRTGLCVERFLASLFRCSSASVKSESA